MKAKFAVNWKEFILEAYDAIARMLFIKLEFRRARRIHVREPRQTEIEHWLRNRH